MPFPKDDAFWMETLAFLSRKANPLSAILAPNEFMEFLPGNYHYNVVYTLPGETFDFVVLHKGMIDEIGIPYVLNIVDSYHVVFANPVFIVYAKQKLDCALPAEHIDSWKEQVYGFRLALRPNNKELRYACVVTTYNRPKSLESSLRQIVDLGAPVVVVDDSSTPDNQAENQRITQSLNVPLINIPSNRGLPNAINTGVCYWLADLHIDWISYFQDDVDVHQDLFTILSKIQDEEKRPLLSGRDATEHPTFESRQINGHRVLYKRSHPGVHLHAHRTYWMNNLPIPTPYLGAPKPNSEKPGQGADEDFWLTAWSPHSITKKNGYVAVVPGLVRTSHGDSEGSTWGQIYESDPPLMSEVE